MLVRNANCDGPSLIAKTKIAQQIRALQQKLNLIVVTETDFLSMDYVLMSWLFLFCLTYLPCGMPLFNLRAITAWLQQSVLPQDSY